MSNYTYKLKVSCTHLSDERFFFFNQDCMRIQIKEEMIEIRFPPHATKANCMCAINIHLDYILTKF